MNDNLLLEPDLDSLHSNLHVERSKNDRNKEVGMKKSFLDYLKLVTVEPAMFLYMLAFMLTSVVEQAFFIHKACRVNLNFTEEICNNLSRYTDKNKEVQVVVSTFHQFNDIASHVIPILLALFIGAWSDRRGRKLLLLLGLLGKLWYSIWIVINSVQDTWTLNEVIWTASFPSGLTGADLSIFAAAFSYISDITTSETRTLRITILDVTYLASMPIGVVLGKYLFSFYDRSYTIMFSLNSSLLLIALLYSFLRLDWSTNRHQKPYKIFRRLNVWSKFSDVEEDNAGGEKRANCFWDFFDKEHLMDSLRTMAKERSNNGRACLIMLIFALGLYTFQRDERQMTYLYTNLKFDWNVNSFSDFRIFQSGLYVAGTLLCIPLMGKYFKFGDTVMVAIGTLSHSSARIVYALAEKPWLFYLGAGFSSLGPVVAPVLRSMASKIVPPEERGKVFAILSVADTTVPLFSGVVYSQVYNATIHTYPGAIFWVTVATQMTTFAIVQIIRCVSRNNSLQVSAESPSS